MSPSRSSLGSAGGARSVERPAAARPVVRRPAGEAEQEPHPARAARSRSSAARCRAGTRPPPRRCGSSRASASSRSRPQVRIVSRLRPRVRRARAVSTRRSHGSSTISTGRPGTQFEPHRARALAGAVLLQVREDRVQPLAADRHAPQRQAHRGLELHEAAEPRWRQVDLLLAVVGRAFGLHLEARRIDREPRPAVGAQPLEFLVQRPASNRRSSCREQRHPGVANKSRSTVRQP